MFFEKEVLNLARPCKSAAVLTECSQTKEEIANRIQSENKLKGKADNIVPAQELNDNQLYLFNYIKTELEASDILGNLDVFILTICVIAIDRLQEIERKINLKPSLMFNKDIKSARDTYSKDFYKCCNELSLSPQSRAKIANINIDVEDKKNDEVLNILNGEY